MDFRKFLIDKYIGQDYYMVSKETQELLIDSARRELQGDQEKSLRVNCAGCNLKPLRFYAYYSKEMKRWFCGIECICLYVLNYKKLNMLKNIVGKNGR